MDIRPIDPSKRPLVRDIQIASWRHAYTDVLPASFLDGDIEDVLGVHWTRDLGDNWIVTGAWEGDDLLGFAALDLTHDGGPYIDNLHVSPKAYRRGAGRAMMADMARRLVERGESSIWLTVVCTNKRAVSFYEAIGAKRGEIRIETMFGIQTEAFAMRWDDLQALAALGHPQP